MPLLQGPAKFQVTVHAKAKVGSSSSTVPCQLQHNLPDRRPRPSLVLALKENFCRTGVLALAKGGRGITLTLSAAAADTHSCWHLMALFVTAHGCFGW